MQKKEVRIRVCWRRFRSGHILHEISRILIDPSLSDTAWVVSEDPTKPNTCVIKIMDGDYITFYRRYDAVLCKSEERGFATYTVRAEELNAYFASIKHHHQREAIPQKRVGEQ